MTASAGLGPSIEMILITRLDALGDIVLGTMLLSGVRARWPQANIRLVVRPGMAGVRQILPDWVEVLPLPFDPRDPITGDAGPIAEQLGAFAANNPADLAIVAEYNRVWAGELLAELCGASTIFAFDGPTGLNFAHEAIRKALRLPGASRWETIHVASEERESEKYQTFVKSIGGGDARPPEIVVRDEDREAAAGLWQGAGLDPERTIVCFPSSGEQLVRSLDAATWARWIARLQARGPVALLGSDADADVLDAIARHGLPDGVRRVSIGTQDVGTLAGFLESARVYVGMDTGPMHVAAALGRPALGVFGGGHRAHRFLPVGPRAAAVRMPIGCYGCDWHCPFDERLCIKRIPEDALFAAGDAFLDGPNENGNVFTPRIFGLKAPADLPNVLLGPVMRQHRRFLQLNHDVAAHHEYLAREMSAQEARLGGLSATLADLARQNHERGEALARFDAALAEMSRHNTERDRGIQNIQEALAEMTRQNESRDAAIAHLNAVIAEMTRHNLSRDEAIARLNEGNTRKRGK